MARKSNQQQVNSKRAAIYARVSDKSQDTEDKTSISEQISDMEAHCERRGLTITARYQEVGRGWSKNRPEFQRMLADARKGRFDTIVCWKSDRLSRGMYPAAALMEVIEAYQIELEAVMDAIDMKTFGLMAAIGKIELDNFRERVTMGKRGSAKQGRIPVNNVPFGYRLGEGRRPEVVDEDVEIIRRVFHMYVREGMGAPAIARQLTAEGVPTPHNVGRWYDRTVTRILGTEAYRGTWWFGKERHVATENGMKRYDRPEDEWVRVPFPPVVDEDLWEQAQQAKKQRLTRSGRNTKIFYLLQHLVRCAECGYIMGCQANRRQTVKRDGKSYRYELDPPHRYYRCYGKLNIGVKCREHSYIRAERLEALVWGQVKKMLENPDLIVAGIEALNSEVEGGGLNEEIAKIERDLQKVQLEEDRAIRLYVSGKITETQLDHQRRFITERLETLREKLNDYRARESAQVERRQQAERVVEWAERIGNGLDDLPQEERREVLRLLLDGATIDKDNRVNLTLAIPTEDFLSIAGPEPITACTPCARRRGAPGVSASGIR
ncbi:MAG: recombinase family protein [Chloroflexota bacterium]|nr:recombinase family protein [Chloroflexota bacterium]